ncbi:hypothetical protein O181_007310 [Austropuccinia psidii MF-1]|uniref:Uncharacterized protein n=1 Tax=Austropuccinia psidii MF-1 TaxID=1389203 RepID=A0A9Q3BMP1_9BASI|nr:hypothetical protein [Austropuccinia psidii MF-1]
MHKSTHQNGFPSYVILKAAELALLYKGYIEFLMLSQQMSLDEHNSNNTQRKMGQSEELSNELAINIFHLISVITIPTSWTVSMDDGAAFAEHWKEIRLSNKHLFPEHEIKPNKHFDDHIPDLIQCWVPAHASATWGYEQLIGVFSKIPTKNKICTSINKRNIFTWTKHSN